MDSPITLAETSQRRAADPKTSAWVAANAGTGKTKVLTDRVLNLLLRGVAPDHILCLTFTKAAAAEMSNRLSRRLAEWAVSNDQTLQNGLTILQGHPPATETLSIARQLFARLLDIPGGMKIQTIHAFCTALLKRFPLEAGIPPHFETLEEQDAASLLLTAQKDVLSQALCHPDSPIAQALALVTRRIHETRFSDLMAEIVANRGKLQRLFSEGWNKTSVRLRHLLGITPQETPDSLLAQACHEHTLNRSRLQRIHEALCHGGKTDQECARIIAAWLSASEDIRHDTWNTYKSAYLTLDGTPRSSSRFPVKAVRERYPETPAFIQDETDRVLRIENRLKAACTAEASEALLILAQAILETYANEKKRQGQMDFDDLILATRSLLSTKEDAAWVLYKLDGGIDHILIDEAQDTSPDQWAVAEGLMSDFFAGDSARSERNRTLFVVGDRKQSIYSFQGADPDIFEARHDLYAKTVTQAQRRWENVALDVSFRSTEAILSVVDRVFASPTIAKGVETAATPIHHRAFRTGHGGSVELWPAMTAPRRATPDPWHPPTERIPEEKPETALARLIARRIKAMIGTERLESRNRTIQAGDILIMVRRRGSFVETLVRALKTLSVPVAGVDRMVLTQQLAVMDLLALGKTLLLPEDDLTLACVLKSPLIGLTEEELFEVAYNRGHSVSLWQSLYVKAATPGPFRQAYNLLNDLRAKTDFLPPYEVFAYILGPSGGRRKLLARLGPDAADSLDEFMSLSLAYDRSHPPNMQAFITWVEASAQEIKRDLEEGGGTVRIMTVHGSKGLQAPVVFLPDVRQIPKKTSSLLWARDPQRTEAPLCLWYPHASWHGDFDKDLVEQDKMAQSQEYRRLLYVALTRAEDRLIVCGWDTPGKNAPEDCWYNLVETAIQSLGTKTEDTFLKTDGSLPEATVWTVVSPQKPDAWHKEQRPDTINTLTTPLPGWIQYPPASEPSPPRPLAPSRIEMEDSPAQSPLLNDPNRHEYRFLRGHLIHRLLQNIPDLPVAERKQAVMTFLARPVWDLSEDRQKALTDEVLSVLNAPELKEVFTPDSLAEAPISGVVPGPGGKPHSVSGQVDRLVLTETEALVVDFKTNRPPPRLVENVPDSYLFQMGAYKAVLEAAFPHRVIRCFLLWTDGPFLMELPRNLLEETFQGTSG